MKYDHRNLEETLPKKKYSNILEIGPGFHSHIDYIKHDYKNYYILEQEKDKLNFYKKRKNNKIKLSTYKKNKMPYKNNFFDRIIMCHVYEHVDKPEEFILEAMSKLKKGGVFSIALPTDPGFFGEWVGCSVKSFLLRKNKIYQ